MSATYTKRDHEASREVTRLFWRANLIDRRRFIVWALTRPLAVLIYTVLIPLVTAYAIQAIIVREFEKVPVFAAIVFAMGVVYCILWAIGGFAVSKGGVTGSVWIQRKIFENYLHKDYEFLNDTYLGTLGGQATRLRDAYNDYNILVLNTGVRLALIITVSVGIITYYSWLLALITVLSMACILSFTIASGRWRLKYRRELSEVNSEVSGVVSDALSQSITVKSFAAEEYEKSRLDSSLSKLAESQLLSWVSSIPADIGRIFLASVAMAALLLLTAYLYQHESIGIAVVVLIQLYVIRLVVATSELADFLKSYESIMSTAHAAVKTMLIRPAIIDPEKPKIIPASTNLTLSFQDVTYRYPEAPSGTAAIDHFSLNIRKGEKVGLIGYSGSGKTTLTKLLLRFVDVTSGSIKLSGVDIRDAAQNDVRRHIGYVPQEPLLFHRTIQENIAYGNPGANQKKIREAGKMAYVDEFIEEMANGYKTVVGEKGVKLSGGQRQRVAIARAMLKDAPILVLDEATSALDSKSERYIQKALWKLMQGRTAIVIAHRLSTIQRMDRIVVMDKGRIVAVGTHEELLKDSQGIYAKLWGHQSGGYIGKADEAKAV